VSSTLTEGTYNRSSKHVVGGWNSLERPGVPQASRSSFSGRVERIGDPPQIVGEQMPVAVQRQRRCPFAPRQRCSVLRVRSVHGTPFGRYRLVELLRRGGMGEVWLLGHVALHGQLGSSFTRLTNLVSRKLGQ
jgi:hypothetical protein